MRWWKLLIPVGLVLTLAACGAAEADEADPGHEDHAAMGHDAPPDAGDATEHSIYLFESSWTDQAGETVRLGDLAGRPRVIAMVYTHCTWACPRILAQMKRIEARMLDEGRDDVGLVLVSIDPERDTPARLATFAESTRLDRERWTVLTGTPGDVQALSVLLGVKIQATDDGEFAHSNVLTVLDAEGIPIRRVEGLDADLEPAVEALLARPR